MYQISYGLKDLAKLNLNGTAVNNSLLHLASDYHLEQLVHESTWQSYTLDLVFCTNPAHVSNVRVYI